MEFGMNEIKLFEKVFKFLTIASNINDGIIQLGTDNLTDDDYELYERLQDILSMINEEVLHKTKNKRNYYKFIFNKLTINTAISIINQLDKKSINIDKLIEEMGHFADDIKQDILS